MSDNNAESVAPINPFDLEYLADDDRWSDLAGEDEDDEAAPGLQHNDG